MGRIFRKIELVWTRWIQIPSFVSPPCYGGKSKYSPMFLIFGKISHKTFEMTNSLLFFSLISIFISKCFLLSPFGYSRWFELLGWILILFGQTELFRKQENLDKLMFGHPDVRTNWCSKCKMWNVFICCSKNIFFLSNLFYDLDCLVENISTNIDNWNSRKYLIINRHDSKNFFFFFSSRQLPTANAESPQKDLNQGDWYCYFSRNQHVILS